MMIACCIPMLVIAIGLVATGVVGLGFIAVAVGCTAMMALMMRGMHDGATEQNTVNHHASHDQGTIRDNGGQRTPPPHSDREPPNDPRDR